MKYFKELSIREIMSKEVVRRTISKQNKKDLRRGKVELPLLDSVAVAVNAREILMCNSMKIEKNNTVRELRDLMLSELDKGALETVLNDIASIMEYNRFNQKCDKYYLESFNRVHIFAENISSYCSSNDLARNFMGRTPLNLCDVDITGKVKHLIKNKDVVCMVKDELAGFSPELVNTTIKEYSGSTLSYTSVPEGIGKLSIIYPIQLGGIRDIACVDVEEVDFQEFRDSEIFQDKVKDSKHGMRYENAYYDTKKCFRIALTTPYTKEEAFYLLVSKYSTDKHVFIAENPNQNYTIISTDCKHADKIVHYIIMMISDVLNKINSVDDDTLEVVSNINDSECKKERGAYSKGQPHKTYVKGFMRRYKSGKLVFVRSHIRYYGYPGKDIENVKTFITIK